MKVSNKQKEVLQKMHDLKSTVTLMRGIDLHCFMGEAMSYSFSTTTLFKLLDLGLIEESKGDSRYSDYTLTEKANNLLKL